MVDQAPPIVAESRQDIVADYPQEVAAYAQEFGTLPADLEFEPGYYCRWQGRTYIHTRATLPLHAIDDGVGFGLWVEIEPSEFERYLEAQQNDEEYKVFKTEGLLANSWPGFMDAFGLPVTVRTIRVDEKVYITEVHLDRMRDILFEVALTAQKADLAMREQILNLVQAWMSEMGGGVETTDEGSGQEVGIETVDEQPNEEVVLETSNPEINEQVAYQQPEQVTFEQMAPEEVDPEQSEPELTMSEQAVLEQEPSGEQSTGEQVVFEQSSQQAPQLFVEPSQTESTEQPAEITALNQQTQS